MFGKCGFRPLNAYVSAAERNNRVLSETLVYAARNELVFGKSYI
jgi:hypothetical protein